MVYLFREISRHPILSALKRFLNGLQCPANKLKMIVPWLNYILCYHRHCSSNLGRVRMKFLCLHQAKYSDSEKTPCPILSLV